MTKKRDRESGRHRQDRFDPIPHVYQHVTSITPLESTGRPGTPHSYFQSSHIITLSLHNKNITHIDNQNKGTTSTTTTQTTSSCQHVHSPQHDTATTTRNFNDTTTTTSSSTHTAAQVLIHEHANGLCVVTLGDHTTTMTPTGTSTTPPLDAKDQKVKIISIQYLVEPAPDGNMNERRKRQSMLIKQYCQQLQSQSKSKPTKQQPPPPPIPGTVTPTTVLANMILSNGTIQPLYAGMWGILVERNEALLHPQERNDSHDKQNHQDDVTNTPFLQNNHNHIHNTNNVYIAIIQPATGSFPPKTWKATASATTLSSDLTTNRLDQQHDSNTSTTDTTTHKKVRREPEHTTRTTVTTTTRTD